MLGRLPRRRDDERYFRQDVPMDYNKYFEKFDARFDINNGLGYRPAREPFPERVEHKYYPGGHMVGWTPRPGRPILDAGADELIPRQTYDPINFDTHSRNLREWKLIVRCNVSGTAHWESEVRIFMSLVCVFLMLNSIFRLLLSQTLNGHCTTPSSAESTPMQMHGSKILSVFASARKSLAESL